MKKTIEAGKLSAGTTVALLLLLSVSACKTAPVGNTTDPKESDGMILTREDIARTGARDAWEAIQRGGTNLNIQFPREGNNPRVTLRGVSSFVLSPEVLLVVDGTHMNSLASLQDIRAETIEYIQILPARTATVRFGTAGGNGVIFVKTGVPPSWDTIPPPA
ncbi:MAG TPA: TonB-dependent receptor plug domain-containing protein [Longimicrobiales bacterium]|nr:TonB-dependent receptor plug domain-containing protein [Longimicrobiales bacterium]